MYQAVEGFRLSSQQARLWRFQQQSAAYRTWCSVVIKGPLEVTRFHQALESTLAHHEIYRTCFHSVPGMPLPLQIVKTETLYSWQLLDLRSINPQEHQALFDALIQVEKTRVLDEKQGPLLLSTLLHLSEQTSLWLIHVSSLWADLHTIHHLVADVARCYQSAVTPIATTLRYVQFSEWQHTFHEQEQDDESPPWVGKDLATLSTISLPFKATTKMRPAFAPEMVHVPLDLTDSTRLDVFLEQASWTLPIFLLTCWSILLRILTGQDEILIGLNADGRSEELQEITGPMIHCLPLVCSLHERQTVNDLYEQIDDAYEETLSYHPYFQGEMLDGMTYPSLFSSPFSFEWREHPDCVTVGPVSFTVQDEECYTEPFQVKLIGSRGSAGISLQIHFDRSLFACQQIQRMATHLSLLIDHVVQHPKHLVGDLNMLSGEERQQLLVQFNATTAAYPRDRCVHELFEQQVARTPDAIALEQGQELLTYQQLNGRANQLARYLQRLGVGPDTLVGIAMDPSLALIIGILGILKAGGAYVPLDTTFPKPRLASMIEGAHLAFLVTQSHMQAALPTIKQVICLDTDWTAIARYSGADGVTSAVCPSHLAYVLYTSGSTGEPKGVMIPHQGMVHYVDWSSRHYEAARGSGSPVHSPLSFDLTITSVFPPLVVGSRLVLVPAGPGIEPLRTTLLQQQQFSILKITPTHLTLLAQSLQPEAFATVAHTLVIGGEALHCESVNMWRRNAPAIRVINEYGPTETVVGCCIHEVAGNEELDEVVPIGRPIPNTQLYVLDAHLRLVPLGVAGELYIGGVGVGRGYLNRPDLTAERFLANPLSEEPGMRLYKTGDMARYMSADGTLEYLGRIDHQVKLRGYRIEPGEIEKVLRRHPQIQNTVVLLQEEGVTTPRLICYVVAQKKSRLTPEAVREILRKDLPEYMIPSVFVLLDELPLTRNGKVDRRQLPRPEQVQADTSPLQNVPRTPLEEMLLAIWTDLLALPSLGIHDNFFAFGGHSLLATRLSAQIRAVLHTELRVQTIFDAPTVAEQAQQVEQALYRGEASLIPPLRADVRPDIIPLSFAQQRLWFLDQLEPESITYLIPMALRIEGGIDISVLEQALQQLVRRHESLRTTFAEHADMPVQVIHPASSLRLPLIDLQGVTAASRESETHCLATQEARHPCDLAVGPLLRIFLSRLTPDEHVLLLTLHHIITDDWSAEIFVRELTMLYRSQVAGEPSPLAPLAIQYADYALWQRGWLQGEVLETQLAYWRARLAGVPVLELPIDHPRPAVQTFRGARESFQLSAAVSKGLVALSRQEHVTLFMTLLAAFQVLLQRYSGQDDFALGTPIANRGHAELEGLIGFFVNTLVMRSQLSGNPTFAQVLHGVREVCLEAYVHQDVPFEQVVEALAPIRDLSRSPLFQVMLVLQNAAQEQEVLAGMSVKPLVVESTISKFDLTLMLSETRHGLIGMLEYNTDLFAAQTITRLLGHWHALLDDIVHNPHVHLGAISLLTQEERHRLLIEWNQTRVSDPGGQRLPHRIAAQAGHIPDCIALSFQDEQLSYAALDHRASRLAKQIQEEGGGPESCIAIFAERDIALLVGVLAVFKAGGAYIPLDPMTPPQRLAQILADAQPRLLLTTRLLASQLPPPGATSLLWLETVADPPAAPVFSWQEEACEREHLAYVIYTSGSTGRPKGVMITQRGMLNHMSAKIEDLSLQAQDCVAQTASSSFDISVWQMWSVLLQGGRVHILSSDEARLPHRLWVCLGEQAITVLQLVPSVLRLLLDEAEGERTNGPVSPDHLRILLATGEALPPKLCQRWQQQQPEIPLVNAYGPTECSDDVTHAWLQAGSSFASERVPIGRPLRNTQLYLLDRWMELVPIGIAGELYVAGEGVGRGYLGAVEQTSVSFVPHPWSQEPGARLYRTGDLARYWENGQIEYLGRIDEQVKLHGYRIELGEIEAVLLTYPALKEAIVLLREDVPGSKQLVAYVVLQPGHMLRTSEVRSFLQERLPAYMLPAAFVVLETLPLTPNGKLDHKALPAPTGERSPEDTAFLAPRTPIEKTLATIWEEVLRTRGIGIQENFFERGGDSIISIQMIARARKHGLHFTLKQLFQYQTIEQLSTVVEAQDMVQAEQGLVLGPVPLTPIQHWFFELAPAQPHHWNQSLFFELAQHLRISLLEQVIRAWLSHHDALRLRFLSQQDGWSQSLASLQDTIPCLLVDLGALGTQEQETQTTRLAAQTQASLDLHEGPLLRVVLFDLGQEHAQCVLLVLHHLAVDGVSWRILVEDLSQAYQQAARGEAIVLPAKTSSFKTWAEHLLTFAQSAQLHEELAFWLSRPWEQVGALPRDLAWDGKATTEASVRGVSAALTVEETHALLTEVPAAYQSQINDVLLTALAQTLRAWIGSSGVLIELEGHGREDLFVDVDLSRTVGWFTSLFPVCLTIAASSGVEQVLEEVKEHLRAIPNHGIGYGILRYLSPDVIGRRQLQALPEAEVSFNYLGQFDQQASSSQGASLIGGMAHLSEGPARSEHGRRRHLLDIVCQVSGNQFRVTWNYGEEIHRRSTIEDLATAFLEALRVIIRHAQSSAGEGYTTADFPEVELSPEQLGQILRELDGEEEHADE